MNIIIEGPDGSGKSTLVKHLGTLLPLTIQLGDGPEKYPGEIVERAWRYLRMDNTLFDRHPIISQPIYGQFREGSTAIPQELIDHLYRTKPLIIYVHGVAGPHEVKDYDTEEHVAMLGKFEDNIRNAYQEWAPGHASITYSVQGGDLDALTKLCQEFCNET